MKSQLSGAEVRKLKSLAQRLEPILRVGKGGLSPGFIQSVEEALEKRELIKIKFVELKEEKDELSAELAEKTSSHLVTRVGNVVVLYRQNPDPERRSIHFER